MAAKNRPNPEATPTRRYTPSISARVRSGAAVLMLNGDAGTVSNQMLWTDDFNRIGNAVDVPHAH